MKCFLCNPLPRAGNEQRLQPEEAKHALQTYRLANGASVLAIDGEGGLAHCTLRVEGKQAILSWKADALDARAQLRVLPIVLEAAVLKNDTMGWLLEKAVELGVREFLPLTTDHTVVQMKAKGAEAFQERWQRIADQALKQCIRPHRMSVHPPVPLREALTERLRPLPHRFWCDEKAASSPDFGSALNPLPPKIHILIGPEGGWSEEERKLLGPIGRSVSLGPTVLRAETASLFAVSLARDRLLRQPRV